MKQETIRKIDSWLGRPLCGLLTVHRRLSERIRGTRSGTPKKILFIKMIEQGTTVLAYEAICQAHQRVGRGNVYFLVFLENREILDIMNAVPSANVIAIRHKWFRQFLYDTFQALLKIRRARIDTTIDLEFFARASAILAYLTGAQTRVGLHRFTSEGPYRGDLMTHRIQHNPYIHTAKAYQLFVESLDEDLKDLPLVKRRSVSVHAPMARFTATSEEIERVQTILNETANRSVARPIVLLNPNASDLLPLRKWDTDRFVTLGKNLLLANPSVTVIITGAPSERPSAEKVCADINSPRASCVAGKTTLRELIVLYTMADILVTNDSGPGHFASLTDIDSIVMFGPETPELFGALGDRTHILWANLACSPCVNALNHRFSPCKNNVCMKEISETDVFAKVQTLLWKRYHSQETVPVQSTTREGN